MGKRTKPPAGSEPDGQGFGKPWKPQPGVTFLVFGAFVRSIIEVDPGPGHYPTHLGGCIGPLSKPSCECGISDLHFAVMALDKAKDSPWAD